jgi:NAD+ diphosphatase
MKHAETVTFGGSGLNRAAEIRPDPAAVQAALDHPQSGVLPMWRGKPLVQGVNRDALVFLAPDHPIFQSGYEKALSTPVLLGLGDDGRPRFAQDISGWMPDGVDEAAMGSFLDQSEQHHPSLPHEWGFAELRLIMTRLSARDAELAATAKAVIGWHATHRFCARCGAASEATHAGWQRTCGSCGGHHFPRTDPVVIMLITHGESVLMGRSPGWPEGMYSLLAGFVEPGETLEAAVRREVWEEAGVKVGHVGYLASQPWPFPASLMFGCSGEALSRDIKIDPAEIEDAMWVTRSEMMAAFAGEHPVLKPARKGAIAHFLLENWLADTLD